MILGISGTPGTGKTTLAKQLAVETGFEHIEITSFAQKHGLFTKKDPKRDTFVLDIDLLQKELDKVLEPNKNYIIDSHLAHDLQIDKCIVCTCNLKELEKRLQARAYSSHKVRENLDAEIFDTAYAESVEKGIEALKIDCTSPLDDPQIQEIIAEL